MKVIVGVSKRHVHLTEETFKKLFGDIELEVRNPIGQPGQFASTLAVEVKWDDKVLERVRIVGPFRKYDQVELSESDAKILGVNPPRRRSGDVEGSLPAILVGPLGEVTINKGLLFIERHIHLTPNEAEELAVQDGDLMTVIKNGEKVTQVKARIENLSALELHIDNDESVEFNLNSGEEVDVIKCGE